MSENSRSSQQPARIEAQIDADPGSRPRYIVVLMKRRTNCGGERRHSQTGTNIRSAPNWLMLLFGARSYKMLEIKHFPAGHSAFNPPVGLLTSVSRSFLLPSSIVFPRAGEPPAVAVNDVGIDRPEQLDVLDCIGSVHGRSVPP